MMPERHNVLLEGVTAGVLGATAVAVWFLIVDTIAGHPLFTPAALGSALLGVFGQRDARDADLTNVVAYTIFHYAAFIAVGVAATALVHRAEQEPTVLVVFLILFVVFELAFYGLTAILSETVLMRELAWYQVGIANLIASVLMGAYVWRRHPLLKQGFVTALGGGEQ